MDREAWRGIGRKARSYQAHIGIGAFILILGTVSPGLTDQETASDKMLEAFLTAKAADWPCRSSGFVVADIRKLEQAVYAFFSQEQVRRARELYDARQLTEEMSLPRPEWCERLSRRYPGLITRGPS